MKHFSLVLTLISALCANETVMQTATSNNNTQTVPNLTIIKPHIQKTITIVSVVGQGVAPQSATSPAHAFALAKRAAITDAYRQLAERIKGVEVEGSDMVKDQMLSRSQIRTHIQGVIRQSTVTDVTYKDGLCEVVMEASVYANL